MSIIRSPRAIDVVILCGGEGKRLRSVVRDTPKPMCEFAGRPFLSLLMEYVSAFGFRRFILATGHLGAKIKAYYTQHPLEGEILYSHETRALGTGGAIRKAGRLIHSDPFLVLNGDSFAAVDLVRFLNFHLERRSFLTLGLVRDRKNPNSGKVALGTAGRILRFEEKKERRAQSFDNAGIYLMNKRIFSYMKKRGKFSLEYDVFPALLKKRCFGFVSKVRLTDFGIPKNYLLARKRFAKGVLIG